MKQLEMIDINIKTAKRSLILKVAIYNILQEEGYIFKHMIIIYVNDATTLANNNNNNRHVSR